MLIQLESNTTAPAAVGGVVSAQGITSGEMRVTQSYSHGAAITPSASAITGGPCDAIFVSASASVTLTLADDSASIAIAMVPGYIYPVRASIVSVVSSGTAYALWHRAP